MIHLDKDIFEYDKEKLTIIGHGCNCIGSYSAGFAGVVANNYPEAKWKYYAHIEANEDYPRFLAGTVNLVKVEDNLIIANLFTQVQPGPNAKIGYIIEALDKLTSYNFGKDVDIRIPMIGAGIGGLDPDDVLWSLLYLSGDLDVYIRSADGHKISDEVVAKHNS